MTKTKLAPAFIVEKHNDHVMFTGTALIPGEPDCDYENGEDPLTEKEVADLRESYKDYGIVDAEHTFLQSGKTIGEPVEDYLLPGPTKMTNIDGEIREYPKGTWVAKTKIIDPEYMKKAEKNEVVYSVTVIPKEKAQEIITALKGRVLMKEVPNRVVGTLTLTSNPCVDNSCSVKNTAVIKAGRSIPKQNKTILEKARDAANEAINTINSLIQAEANNGGKKVSEKDKKEFVTKSDLVGFKDEILEAVKAAPVKPDPNAKPNPNATPPTPTAAKCPDCGAVVGAKDKFCKACGAEIKPAASGKSKEDKTEEGGESKALKNHDDGKEKASFKSIEYYMGRNARGRPIKKPKEE